MSSSSFNQAPRVMLLGKFGTGKTYISDQFISMCGATRLSFGAPVYRLAEAVLGRKISKSNIGDREYLTLIGTSWGRNGEEVPKDIGDRLSDLWPHKSGYKDVWVDELSRETQSLEEGTPIVVDDVRFSNEFWRLFENLKFMPACVACSSDTRARRLTDRGDRISHSHDKHESEYLSNLVSELALQRPIMPVIWNDDREPAPNLHWVFTRNEWLKIVCSERGRNVFSYDTKTLKEIIL